MSRCVFSDVGCSCRLVVPPTLGIAKQRNGPNFCQSDWACRCGPCQFHRTHWIVSATEISFSFSSTSTDPVLLCHKKFWSSVPVLMVVVLWFRHWIPPMRICIALVGLQVQFRGTPASSSPQGRPVLSAVGHLKLGWRGMDFGSCAPTWCYGGGGLHATTG